MSSAAIWRLTRYITGAALIGGIAWVATSFLRLGIPTLVFVVLLLGMLAVNLGLGFWAIRVSRAEVARVVAAHPGVVATPSVITSWPESSSAERGSVIVLAADRRGLSFRDAGDREVLLIPADRIMTLEVAPLEPRARFRPLRVTTIDGLTLDFTGPGTPDAQVDAIVALRTALGRPAG